MSVEFFHYVPRGFVHVWEREGWVVTDILEQTHHDLYSVMMKPGPNCKWQGDEPVRPTRESLEAA